MISGKKNHGNLSALESLGRDLLVKIGETLPLSSKASLGCTNRFFFSFWQNDACSAADYGSSIPHRYVGRSITPRHWHDLTRERVHFAGEVEDEFQDKDGTLAYPKVIFGAHSVFMPRAPSPECADFMTSISYSGASKSLLNYARLNNEAERKPWYWPSIVDSLTAQKRAGEAKIFSDKIDHYRQLQNAVIQRDFLQATALLGEKIGPIWLAQLSHVLNYSANLEGVVDAAHWIVANLYGPARQQDLDLFCRGAWREPRRQAFKAVFLHAMSEIPPDLFRSLLTMGLSAEAYENIIANHPRISLSYVQNVHNQRSIWPSDYDMSQGGRHTQNHLRALGALSGRGLLPLSGIDDNSKRSLQEAMLTTLSSTP